MNSCFTCLFIGNISVRIRGPGRKHMLRAAVGVPSLRRLRLQCNCSILLLTLYIFVVAV